MSYSIIQSFLKNSDPIKKGAYELLAENLARTGGLRSAQGNLVGNLDERIHLGELGNVGMQ
jgi:hypothetical protein